MAQIKTYARLKPSKKPYSGYEINKNVLTVHIPDLVVGSQQALRSNLSYDIMFTDIFRPGANQEDVFDGVAKGIIQSFLNGYNGTIFAYGQTGTGKTYTVEGNTTRYSTRGLSTRALSMIYQQLENRTDDHITVCLSYLEIYQEVAYDLLNPISRSSLPMAPFAKVTVVEGPRGSCIFRGLSLHLAANEEIAQMLLLQGQANRRVAETPVNQRSSRSHAVFTVYLQVRKHDSDVLLNSKLHLVDLAGSERVSKTGVDGQQLTEAKSINLSLHHLETVIIALQTERSISSSSSGGGGEKNRGDYPASQSRSNTSFMSGPSSDNGTKPYKYVPYRNSLLTMVLKDSLGGNCLTAMIATISMEPENLGESISTCRFAQRVAHIANNARRNEEVDDKTVIKRLRHKVANLEHQLSMLRSKGRNDSIITNDELLSILSEDDRSTCAKIMDGFLQGVIADPVDAGIYDQRRFRECLHLLKHQYLNSVSSNCQFLTSQQLQVQPRPAVTEQSTEGTHPLQPNNPHRDSGDHAMSEATQADSSVFISQQRPVCRCPSEHSMNANEEFLLANEDQVVGAVSAATGTDMKFADKIGSETEQLLDACAGQKLCSQSDRQRMKEFKKQGHKMTSMEQEQAVKQEQLSQMSQDILMQELMAAENSLRLKLQTVEEQVVQQHSYLMQLKHNQADVVQIAREQLVEQHLMKRQTKFHDKLIKLLENKAKLKCAISPDLTSLVCGGSNRPSAEEKFVPLKQGKACQTCLLYEEKELSTKVDRDKGVPKTKPQDIKEPITPDKAREIKQKFRLPQQQADPMFGMNMEQFLNKSDMSQVQSSDSVDSNRSLRGNEGSYKFSTPVLESNVVVNEELKNDHSKQFPSKTSSTTGLQSKEKSLSEIYHATEPQGKHFQDYLASGHKERLVEDARLVKCSNIIKPNEIAKRLENGSSYSLRNNIPPYQDADDNSAQIRPGVGAKNPLLESEDVLIESPTINGALPIEVRSFHDPHHSHKFALDDMPTECSSLSNAEMGTIINSDNKNNSYIRFVHSLKNQHLQCINYNTNAITDILEESETDKENEKSAQDFELQNHQCPVVLESSLVSSNSVHNSAPCDPVKTLANALHAGTELTLQTLDAANPENYSKKSDVANDIAETVAGHSNEELTESPKLCTTLPSHVVNSTLQNQPTDIDLSALACGELKEPFSVQDPPTLAIISEPNYVLELKTRKHMDIIPSEVSSFKKCSSTSKSSSLQNGDHCQVLPRNSAPETSSRARLNKLNGLSSDTEPVVNSTSTCSTSTKNDYSAGGEKQIMQRTSVFLSIDDGISGDSKEHLMKDAMRFHNEPDSTNLNLDKFRSDEQVDDDDRYDDNYDDDLMEANSFFGLHPPDVKLKALTFEERERTYMLTVAAERARVVKIRKARKAAEIIQGFWRAYRTEE